jgi:hypothetical protein
MPPKKATKPQTASKKTEQKKKQSAIEDKTFGLKNKNKSKKVQQYVQQVKTSVLNSGDRKQRQLEEQRKKQKAEAKLRKKAEKEEQNALFNEALGALSKKKTNLKEGKTEAKGRDADEDNNKKTTSRAMKMMYQMDGEFCVWVLFLYIVVDICSRINKIAAKEMEERLREDPNYVPTLEDKIEAERQTKVDELKKSGKGTPVTPETFAAWQERKRKRKAEEAKKLVETELKKKKGGKGLGVLSGRALYEYKKDLFNIKDDDDNDMEITEDDKKDGDENTQINGNDTASNNDVEKMAETIQTDLFLEGDDDLDDLEDD